MDSTQKNKEKKNEKVFVPDTSALINGIVSDMINKGQIKGKILIPKFVLAELENQANKGKEIGFLGMEEIKLLKQYEKEGKTSVEFVGRLPTMEEIQLAKSGRIDHLIRDIAYSSNAVLITADLVQAKVGEAMGMEVMYFEKEHIEKLTIEKFFDDTTSSIHLKEGATPKAKKGVPGKVRLVELSKEVLTREEIEKMIKEILDKVRRDKESFIEIGRYEATVIQMGQYRIAITRPPFSDATEITVVKPIYKLSLEDYKLKDKLIKRFKEEAEGIVIAGPPGSGKTTFAQALAEFFFKMNKIVKTMEQPRDLDVPRDITQYSALGGDMEKTADILLLVRPDYTIYDEVRKTKDFKIFADLRMAGIGMLGVVHASKPIEAIQRFVGRVELGLIPQIVDTVIFIRNGKVEKVQTLNLTVKTPTGMTEADLARPVVEVRDFETQKLEYEIYTYGEQTVVMDINALSKDERDAITELAKMTIERELRKHAKDVEVEVTGKNRAIAKVSEKDIPHIIGKKGKKISSIEEKLGIKIDVQPNVDTLKKDIPYTFEEKGAYINLWVNKDMTGKNVDIYKGDEYLFSATVGKEGKIKVKKRSEIGKRVLQAYVTKELTVKG